MLGVRTSIRQREAVLCIKLKLSVMMVGATKTKLFVLCQRVQKESSEMLTETKVEKICSEADSNGVVQANCLQLMS